MKIRVFNIDNRANYLDNFAYFTKINIMPNFLTADFTTLMCLRGGS